MADKTYAQIVAGEDEATLFSKLLALLQHLPSGLSLPTSFWGGGDPQQVILQHGLSPLLAELRRYAAQVALGGFLRGALALAKADLDTWNTDPLLTFLGWLAQEVFSVTPYPPSFAQGTLRVTNVGGPVTLPAAFSVRTSTGLVYQLVGGAQVVGGGVSYVQIIATQPGSAYNVSPSTITFLVTSLAGITVSNEAQAPATSWLITYGGLRETPDSVVARCRANWARLSLLQTSPADAYVALALDQRITGTSAVKKVAVWPHYKDGVGHAANYVTLYLAGDAAPVSNPTAAQVQAALLPYLGLHDLLVVAPCGTGSYAPAAICYVDQQTDVGPAWAGITLAFTALQTALPIGGTVYAAGAAAKSVQGALSSVPQVQEIEAPGLVDNTPAKNALLTLSTSNISVLVGRP